FRVELLARLLGPSGADWYFAHLGRSAPGRAERRRLADAVLEQILGAFTRPRAVYRDHAAYLDGIFAHRRNRHRAAGALRSLMGRLGGFWGPRLAIRGHPNGESLVPRNVGIAPAWSHGRWRVALVFMDHDDLHLPTRDDPHFRPDRILPGTFKDEA